MKILIDECSIDLVPTEWKSDSKIANHFNKYKRLPLRNGSIHQHLLKNYPLNERLDRPDILHFGLLTILGYTPLIPMMEVYFSCRNGLFEISPDTRLPRDQNRFYGIIEKLFSGDKSNKFITESKFIANENRSLIFSSKGHKLESINIHDFDTFIFGGFAYGNLIDKYKGYQVVSLSDQSLDLWTALSIFLNKIK